MPLGGRDLQLLTYDLAENQAEKCAGLDYVVLFCFIVISAHCGGAGEELLTAPFSLPPLHGAPGTPSSRQRTCSMSASNFLL